MERSASSLRAANNTIDESIAMITAANEVTQNPEKVGNALKTISMRIRSAKSEMEEMGEDTTGMVESTAKLRQEIMALSGVDIMQDANTFKSTYQIMDELAAKWENLTDIQQASIIELMAGKHQGNVFSSLMQNFQTARDALQTSINSSGSAMTEHAKWSESIEARLNKLKASWQSFSQTFMDSDLLKGGIDVLSGFVNVLDKLIEKLGVLPTIFAAFAIGKVVSTFTGLIVGAKTLGDVVAALSLSFTSLNPVLLGIAAAAASLYGLYKLYDKNNESAAELSDRIEEVTTNYKKQHAELSKIKADYDTTSEDSMISKYGELSKGVNSLGENISLTADEYAEYQSIVNEIANTNPDLVTGYNSQGDAILKCAGDVNALAQAYRDLIKAKNDEVTDVGSDVLKDFRNDLKDTSAYYEEVIYDDNGNRSGHIDHFNTEHLDKLEELMNLSGEKLDSAISNLTVSEVERLSNLLEEQGIERNKLGSGEKGWETQKEHIVRALNKDKAEIKTVIDKATADLNTYAKEMGTVTSAYFSTAFLGGNDKGIGNYSHLSEKMQNVITQATSGLGIDFYTQFLDDNKSNEENYAALVTEYNKILSAFDSMSDTDSTEFEAAFDLKTQFNGGDIPYGEYVSGIQKAGKLVDKLGLDKEITNQIKLSLGLNEDGLVSQYESLLNRLTETNNNKIATGNVIGLSENDAEKLLDDLSSEELSVLTKILPEIDVNATREQIEAAIEREMVASGLVFDLNLEVEAAGIESLNTALSETVSASGLSSESISALKGRYADLESQGWDLSSMFEETSHGVRLNRKEFNKFESELSKQKLDKVNNDLDRMKAEYDRLGEAIENASSDADKSKLFNDRQSLAQKISEAATLASQYRGLTSAYNDWIAAEESGNERDMYENVINGFETVKDELSRGWADDSTIEFLELITGRTDLAGKSGKELKEVYDGLGESIKYLNKEGKVLEDTGYSVRDFFTVDDNGNSTSKGVYNFLDAIGKLEEEAFLDKDGKPIDVIKRNPETQEIIGFDFDLAAKRDENGNIIKGGDEVIAEALGISEEFVQIMARAADDAGFVVSMDGTYRQLADLQNEAKTAANYLKEIGKTDFEFDFNTSNVSNLTTQLEKAKEIWKDESFWNQDGTFNFDAEGATQAMQVVSTLQAKIDSLTKEKYGIGLTVEDKKFEEPLEKLQDYGNKVAELNQLKLNPKTNAKEIEKLEGDLDTIAEDLINLSKNKNIDIGIKPSDDVESVKQKIADGEIKIPTTLDIQTNMDKNISDLRDIALLNSGLLSEEQESEIKIRLGIEVEPEVEKVDPSIIDKNIQDSTSAYWSENKGKITVNPDVEIKAGNVESNIEETIDNEVETGVKGRLARMGVVGGVIGAKVELDPEVDTSGAEQEIEDATNKVIENQSGKEKTVNNNVDIKNNVTTNNTEEVANAAKALEDVESKYVSVGADITGNVTSLTADQINNVALFADAAKLLQDVEGKSVWVDATINGNVLDFDSDKVGNLKTFAQGAKELQDVEGKSVWVDATISGNAIDVDSDKVGNLKTFAEGVKELQDVEGKSVWADATISGNAIDVAPDKLGNLKTFAEGASGLKDVESKTISITANFDGSVLKTGSEDIAKLKAFASNAKELDGVKNKTVTITANFEGTLKDSGDIDNLTVFAENAKKLEGVGDSDVIVTASIYGNLNTWSGSFDDLTKFASSAKSLKDIDSKDVSITANIDGNLTNDSVSRLEKFASVVNTTSNKSVDIGVKASVDVDSVNTAIELLRQVSTSGLFKDYAANVTATVSYNKGEQTKPDDKDASVNYKLGAQDSPEDKTAKVNYALGTQADPKSKTVYVNYVENGTGGAAGTANATGTAGRAFARGNWGTQDSGIALGGELGRRYCDHT